MEVKYIYINYIIVIKGLSQSSEMCYLVEPETGQVEPEILKK